MEQATEFVEAFDLDFLNQAQIISDWVGSQFRSPVHSIAKVGQGFYAQVFKAVLQKDPGAVIIKCHFYAGRGEKEKAQLDLLRRYAVVNVPEVYLLHKACEEFPCEALVMEYIPGINAGQATFPDQKAQDAFVDTAIANLKVWHSVTNAAGFGEIEGPFSTSWQEAFSRRIGRFYERLQQEKHRAVVSANVMRIIDRSYEAMPAIFEGSSGIPSLVHSDYNAWNMMVDPASGKLTGIIDPIDAGWADAEIDLFHLPNCRPELGMLERYLDGQVVDEAFWMRFRFYRFWDDVKHYLRMGWYEEGRFWKYGSELAQSMDICRV